MANYPGALRFPSLEDLQNEFSNQLRSASFRDFTLKFCKTANISIDELLRASTQHLNSSRPQGVADLAEFMNFLNSYYRLSYTTRSQILYKAVKGLPSHSHNHIGYTFNRRRSALDRGVFVFLR
jgi:hypothetical protein